MPPGKLQNAILAALGVAVSACGEKDEDTGDTSVGPCLSEQIDTGPCLDYMSDTGDTGDTGDTIDTGPCLDYPADTGDTGAASDTGSTDDARSGSRDDATRRILDRGILPEDIAKRLAKRLKGS
ncbi:MAG: hypothetical protein P8R54_23390 [Myxococcota bacterium]|nr:hypothetical protein [Myxococcota bacterium]